MNKAYNNTIEKDILTLGDGFKYWWPKCYPYGAFSSHTLREIADRLDGLNAEWTQQINDYFNEDKES